MPDDSNIDQRRAQQSHGDYIKTMRYMQRITGKSPTELREGLREAQKAVQRAATVVRQEPVRPQAPVIGVSETKLEKNSNVANIVDNVPQVRVQEQPPDPPPPPDPLDSLLEVECSGNLNGSPDMKILYGKLP